MKKRLILLLLAFSLFLVGCPDYYKSGMLLVEQGQTDLAIEESERLFRWPQGRRPDDHPGLSELGL